MENKRGNKKGARVLSSGLKNIQILNSKRSFEMAISTLVVIVLGVLLLIGLTVALTGGFKNFFDKIKAYSGSEIDNIQKICKSQCDLENKQGFCCGEKILKKENVTCLDSRVKSDCGIDCEGVC